MPPTLTSSFLLPSWAPTALGPHAHGTRPCGPCRGHSFQTPGHVLMVSALRTAPTRTLLKRLRLTTWSRPHVSSRPTRVPALTRTLTVTSPRPGSAPRHLPTRTHPIFAAPLRPAGPPGSGPTEPALSALNPNSGRATIAPDRHYYLGNPLHGRHDYLPARRMSGQPPPALAICIMHRNNADWHVNGTQQPPSCRPAGGLVGFEPHGSVSDTQPRACCCYIGITTSPSPRGEPREKEIFLSVLKPPLEPYF
jgi:hypothetical protein